MEISTFQSSTVQFSIKESVDYDSDLVILSIAMTNHSNIALCWIE